MAGGDWHTHKWRLDFSGSQDGGRMWSRYLFLTALRAVKYGPAAVLSVLGCVDQQPLSSQAGAGWFAARYVEDEWLILMDEGLGGSGVVVPTTSPTGLVSATGVPGLVDPSTLAASQAKAAAMLAGLAGAAWLHVCGHGYGGAQAPIVASLLAHALPGAQVRLLTFGAFRSGNRDFCAGVNVPWLAEQNPWDPIVLLPLSTSGHGGYFGLGVQPAARYAQGGTVQWWSSGYGEKPAQSFWSGGVDGRGRYLDEARAFKDVAENQPPVANHMVFFYTTAYYLDTIRYVPSQRQAVGLVRGYDLDAIDTQNAALSHQDSLVVADVWPVPVANWPHV